MFLNIGFIIWIRRTLFNLDFRCFALRPNASHAAAGPYLKPISLYLKPTELISLAQTEEGHDGEDRCQKMLRLVSIDQTVMSAPKNAPSETLCCWPLTKT